MIRKIRLPLIPALIAYISGLYLGRFDFPSAFHDGSIFILLILLALWAILIVMKRAALGSWAAVPFFLFLGIFSVHLYLCPPVFPSHISQFNGCQRIGLEGIVDSPPRRSRDRTELLIRSENVFLSNHRIPVEGKALLFLKEESKTLRLGDRVRILCSLYSPHGFHNPGGFSYERHLAFERVHTVGFLVQEKGCVKIGQGLGNPLHLGMEGWRDRIRYFLEREAHPASSGILKALVLGERDDIPEKVSDHFVTTGIAHLLAISGDHLGIVALLSFFLLIWILKRSEFLLLTIDVKKWAAGLTIPCILLYSFIAGGGISIIRATIMVITFFLSILFNRERHLLHTLALAAFIILLFSPPSLFDVSFQLSFLAVLSILYMVPRVLPRLKRERLLLPPEASWKGKIQEYFKISFLATGVAILGTAPFVALHFNRISPIGFLTNLFIIPWVGFFIVPLSLVASLLSFIFYPFACLLIQAADFFVAVLLKAVAFFASIPYASSYVSTPTVFEILLSYFILFTSVHLQKKTVRYLFLGLFVLLIFDLTFWSLKGPFQKDLVITFIDVGHGDSVLLEFPKGKTMLIDGGGLYGDRFDIGKNVVAPFLWKKKIRKIDILVLTHPDPDHLKGLNFIASHFSIGQFWESGLRSDSESYSRLVETLRKKKVERFSSNEGSPPVRIHGVQISFLNPQANVAMRRLGQDPSFLNNHSLAMMVQFKKIKVLLTGDIEKEAEYRLLKEGCSLRADVLKVPHHGSASSSTPLFLARVEPGCAVFSVGERNIGRLPHPEVIQRYQEIGAQIFRTDHHGAITVTTDGEKIVIMPFLNDTPHHDTPHPLLSPKESLDIW